MRLTLLFPTLLLAAPTFAQVQVVHPNQYATTQGVTDNAFPFAFSSGVGRYQQTYDATQFPGPLRIERIGFRYNGLTARAGGPIDVKVTASTCLNAWNAPSGLFASNTGNDATVTFDGPTNIPPFPGGTTQPNPFTFLIVFTTPFDYDPANGDLLLDFELRQTNTASGAFARATNAVGVYRIYDSTSSTGTSGSVSNVGLITEFTGNSCNGSTVSFGVGCPDSSGTTFRLTTAGCPDQGATFTLQGNTGPAVTSSMFVFLGLSNQLWGPVLLPVDLTPFGAPNCFLYTSQDTLIGPLANPGGGASLTATFPAVIPGLGVPFYAQGVMIDPGANLLNLATTNGIEITTG